ncbi:MAG: DUF4097 domain-containing protein [Gaiellaceae bacterium]
MTETFQTPGPVTLVLRVPAGEIEIETVGGAETRVELEPDDEARVDCRRRGDEYEVLVEVKGRALGRQREYRLRVQAPDGARVDANTKSADVLGRGRFASIQLNTASGDVSFDEVEGAVKVNSATGEVGCARIGGEATISTASGDVEVQDLAGPATIRSASGDVSIGSAGPDLSVQTASGDGRIAAVTEGKVDLKSASGDLRIGISRGSRLWVDAKSLSGETSSELDVGDTPVGDDGPLVELRATTLSGDIEIVRA